MNRPSDRAERRGAGHAVSPRWLEWLAVVLIVAGAALLVMPASVRVPSRSGMARSDTMPVTLPPSRRDGPDVRDVVVRTNLFSTTRRAPSERFVVPGQELAQPSVVPDAAALSSGPYDIQLFGVLEVDGSRRALLQVGSADSVPRVVGLGDRLGGYRVRRILADRVELSSASGTRIVRLQRRPESDSSGVMP